MSRQNRNRKKTGKVKLNEIKTAIPLQVADADGIRLHTEIPEDLDGYIRLGYNLIGHIVEPTFERWEDGFLYEKDIEGESKLWCRMGMALRRFLKEKYGAFKPDIDEDTMKGYACTMVAGVSGNPRNAPGMDSDNYDALLKHFSEPFTDEEFDELYDLTP